MAHALDDRSILPTQTPQLSHLIIEIATPDVDDTGSFGSQIGNTGSNGGPQDRLPAPHHTLCQDFLKRRQATGLQQHIVTGNFCDQALLSRNRYHLLQRDAQHLCRGPALPAQLGLNLLRRVQRVPERINLVENHQPRIHAVRGGRQVFSPY